MEKSVEGYAAGRWRGYEALGYLGQWSTQSTRLQFESFFRPASYDTPGPQNLDTKATHPSPTKSLWTARRPPYALILSRPGDHSYGSLDKPHLSFTGVLQTPRLPDAPSLDHSLERSGDLGTIRVAWSWTCGDSMFSPTLTPASDAKASGAHLRGTIGLLAWLALCRFGGEIDILVHDLRQ
jgi:hypothetical protein